MPTSVITSKSLAPKRRARNTTVAWKILMAVTGIVFVIFVLAHMYGNLKVIQGPEAYNGYAEWLRIAFYPVLPERGLLWLMRIALILSLGVHVLAALRLWNRARIARGTPYVKKKDVVTTYAARTMRWGGVIIFGFLVFHLAQFTWLMVNIGADYQAMMPYDRMVFTFQQWYWVGLYAIVMVTLGLHVRHGLWSLMATLGGNRQKWERTINWVAILVSAALVVGFMLPPVLIFLDVVN
ncbi:MAG TPA: succinate dehydrogenase cytochrome b subunit [Actinomycetaceae bacterium]|nr:succinate dehydrogenase cytochrome b subunit [Actinomycetaceae bacterium]